MLEIPTTEYISLLAQEAKDSMCAQSDPHCAKNHGDLCERGCFEVTIDLQTMTVVEETT